MLGLVLFVVAVVLVFVFVKSRKPFVSSSSGGISGPDEPENN